MTAVRARATPDSAGSREKIVAAVTAELRENGLTNWTVEAVAKRAQCAKGLVIYHFQSKDRLLQLVAERLRTGRSARLVASLNRSGTEALDHLWETMNTEVRSGTFALWLSLVADPQTIRSATIDASSRHHLVTSIATALGIRTETVELQQVPTFLDGIQLQLLMGTSSGPALREQYDRYWLQLLNASEAG